MAPTLSFESPNDAVAGAALLVVVGRSEVLRSEVVVERLPPSVQRVWERLLDSVKTGDAGDTSMAWTEQDHPARVVACVLPEPLSRYNSPSRPHAVASLVRKGLGLASSGKAAVLLAMDDPSHLRACALAVARALPLYSSKSGSGDEGLAEVSAGFLSSGRAELSLAGLGAAADGVRLAARLVDAPTSELTTTAFVAEARQVADEVGAQLELISGADLDTQGFGGLWGVGKAATHKPALAILSCGPEDAERTLAWVGKGIVYDTGGLSIKGKDGMPGMKADMGGAAAVLGAFAAAARLGTGDRLHALLCLAENSVGPEAMRPDDILHMYSGKTVEVNNTDAEGRLVLADGVAYATRHLSPDVVVDLATLTGAQLIATGKRHAAIVCDDEDLEAAALRAGRASGDLVHPLPWCPEFFRKEFKSGVADMKNSVKDRMNAQSSCAAQFVGEHLDGDYDGAWLHVDIAGPSTDDARGTGFGVGLLLELFGL